MRKIGAMLVGGVIAALVLAGCNFNADDSAPEEIPSEISDESSYPTDDIDMGGFGMTYDGKLGYNVGGGYVIPFDGSKPGFGF